jgi:ubiquinone/menaquinone biosynthesis C-methylase UbiE
MKKILNLGCGEDNYGTDRLDFVKTKTTTKVSDLNKKFPYKDNSFDEVYSKSVIEHIKNLGIFVDEAYRVLKKGGKIYILTDFAGYIPFFISKKNEHNNYIKYNWNSEDAHYHLFVESHLRLLFKKFKNIKINYFYGGGNAIKRLILKSLPFHLGAIHIILTAEK